MLAHTALLAALLPSALGMGVLFPAYFCGNKADCYATDCPDFEPIIEQIEAHPGVPFYTIINPASGPLPAAALYPNYAACVPALKDAGDSNIVLGYVRTNYTARAPADVEADIDAYSSWDIEYRPAGIFFDEVSADAESAGVYSRYAVYARDHGYSFIVFNPGAAADASLYPEADLVLTHESAYASFDASADLAFSASTPASKQAVVLYGAPAADAPRAVISQLGARDLGAVFVTDAAPPNPYAAVPAFFADEVAAVDAA